MLLFLFDIASFASRFAFILSLLLLFNVIVFIVLMLFLFIIFVIVNVFIFVFVWYCHCPFRLATFISATSLICHHRITLTSFASFAFATFASFSCFWYSRYSPKYYHNNILWLEIPIHCITTIHILWLEIPIKVFWHSSHYSRNLAAELLPDKPPYMVASEKVKN